MYRVCLVNMPFSALSLPSIALTQLKSVAEKQLGDRVAIEVHYLNHEVAKYLGRELYDKVSDQLSLTGLGDWMFRHVAFPEAPDNAEGYFARHHPARDPEAQALKESVREKHAGLDGFLDQLIDTYRLDRADLVGFTSMFAQNVASFAMARKLKHRKADLITVIGGANCEFPMGQVIARTVEQIDFVASGPGLRSFPQLLEHAIAGRGDAMHRLDGLFSRRNSAGIGNGGVRQFGAELPIDEEVELDYAGFLDALAEKFPGGEVDPVLLFETSRGCWWGARAHCTFCGLNGSSMAYRSMEPERARRLIERLFRYVPRVKRLMCVDNIMPKEYPEEVFARLTRPPGVSIFYEVKADLTAPELEVLARAGVNRVQPGIEALASSTLRLMRKGTTAPRNIEFLKDCLAHGVQPAWNLLVGFPKEGEEVYRTYYETLPRLVHLPPPSGAFPVRFDRFSPYFVEAERYGLDLAPMDFYRHVYPWSDEDLTDFAYYFSDRHITAKYFMDVARWLSKLVERTSAWRERWSGGPDDPPMLFFMGQNGSTRVFDSRFEQPVEHQLSPLAQRILEVLRRPIRRQELDRQLSDVAEDVLDGELGRLSEKALIFQEDIRMVSLVSRQAPRDIEIFST